jgi:hypothetical protein
LKSNFGPASNRQFFAGYPLINNFFNDSTGKNTAFVPQGNYAVEKSVMCRRARRGGKWNTHERQDEVESIPFQARLIAHTVYGVGLKVEGHRRTSLTLEEVNLGSWEST